MVVGSILDVENLFWDQVNMDGPLHPIWGKCWVWLGRTMNGYGDFKGGLTHRYSWALYRGIIPPGLSVLHRCDNPSCVNPDHLFLGTQQDNLADMRAKGRQVRGERQGQAILTADLVRYIRGRYKRYSHDDGAAAIARDLGLSLITVWKAATRETWRHI